MEARLYSAALVAAAVLSMGASHRTNNFMVTAATQQLAREICEKAENDRRRLAIEWLGAELPRWRQPCPIRAHVGPQLGAGGATSFAFYGGGPRDWTMTIQGSRERLLDSVLPHEVTHTIFATHFGRPLPRWADEGACTTVEHESERSKQEHMLITFLKTRRGIAFNNMFAMTEYPRDVLPLYSQGYSLARFLIAQGGKRKFVNYIGDGMNMRNWPAATKKHYRYKDLSELQVTWLDWVRRGSPPIDVTKPPDKTPELVADNQPPKKVEGQVAMTEVPAQERSSPNAKQATLIVPVVRVNEPQDRQAVQATVLRSWYLEQRDLTKSLAEAIDEFAEVPSKLNIERDSYAPGSIKSGQQSPTILSRPQPIGRPKQQVLEFTNPLAPKTHIPIETLPNARGSQSTRFDATAVKPGTKFR